MPLWEHELQNAYIGEYIPHFATQGPSPDGYHVPLISEWVALCGILTTTFSLNSNRTTMKTYLKMPPVGYRSDWNGGIESQNSFGIYWSSSGDNTYKAYYMYFDETTLIPQVAYARSRGCSVRCFKDYQVVPDSSWTTLYDGSGVATGAGIFYNSTLGLISISGDGANWTTIQDKNLGATTIYNSGNALSEANCGGYFQWGNNYMFPFTGSVTTSSTQVDASAYGPGNYYSSSTFIGTGSSWDSSNNANLWGGEDGNVPVD